jgi:hypothetical protein
VLGEVDEVCAVCKARDRRTSPLERITLRASALPETEPKDRNEKGPGPTEKRSHSESVVTVISAGAIRGEKARLTSHDRLAKGGAGSSDGSSCFRG